MKKNSFNKRPNAKVQYITTTASSSLLDCCNTHLPKSVSSIKVIQSGGVWLNKKRLENPNILLPSGTTLKVYLCPTQGYKYLISKELIIKETTDWVIIFKIPLITIAMDRSNKYFNLMAGLNDYYGFKDMSSGVQPITRLDYNVSGLCLFSKNKSSERKLFKLMEQRKIKKRYLVSISNKYRMSGIPTSFSISNKLSFSYKAVSDTNGKSAKTWFIFNSKNKYTTNYYALTKTGRRHQIRYHASKTLGPIINDNQYGKPYHDQHLPIGLLACRLSFPWKNSIECINLPLQWINLWKSWLQPTNQY